MDDSTGVEIMGVVLGTIARVHALEHSMFALMASHPYPEVALSAWDQALPGTAERGVERLDAPEYRDVLSRMLAEHRRTLVLAVEAKANL